MASLARLPDRSQVMTLVSAGGKPMNCPVRRLQSAAWPAWREALPGTLPGWACALVAFMAAGAGSGCRHVMTQESLLDALGAGGSDALVDGKRLLQVGGAFTIVAVLEVAAADSFQGTCFF
jgi:hypothetical protein